MLVYVHFGDKHRDQYHSQRLEVRRSLQVDFPGCFKIKPLKLNLNFYGEQIKYKFYRLIVVYYFCFS